LLLVYWPDKIFLEWSSPKHDGLELVEWSQKVEWSAPKQPLKGRLFVEAGDGVTRP